MRKPYLNISDLSEKFSKCRDIREYFFQRSSANSLDGRDGGARRWTGHFDWKQPRPAARLPHPWQGRPPRAPL